MLSPLIVAYTGDMYSIADPLTKIPKKSELRGFQITQNLGFRALFERPWSYMCVGGRGQCDIGKEKQSQ